MSHASYLVADETTGQAVIVDPRRDIDDYLADARAAGVSIVGVINTHVHADFVAGNLELAAATGAWIGFGERAVIDHRIRPLAHGEHLRLGEVDLEIISTPGHTWESISIVIREHADSDPDAVCTGDAMFVGDVGRPDLASAAPNETETLARAQFSSIHRLLALPDDTRVLPAHGAGSSCGKNLSAELSSTIGEQRRTNYAAQPMSEAEFVALITDGQPPAPAYFAVDARLNRQVRALYDSSALLSELTAAQLRAVLEDGTTCVIDTRGPDEFAEAHLSGSVNIGLDGRFAETAGMLVPHDVPVVVLTVGGRGREAVTRLGRIGIDRVVGHHDLSTGIDEALRPLTRTASRLHADELRSRPNLVVLDVRNPGERESGAIDGSVHIPLPQLAARHDELHSGADVVVYCAGGWRSSVAASFLRASGHDRVRDLEGGFSEWLATAVATAGR
nr:MBL fold metallo-hydrolase [Rhodococcus sp. HNM0569]